MGCIGASMDTLSENCILILEIVKRISLMPDPLFPPPLSIHDLHLLGYLLGILLLLIISICLRVSIIYTLLFLLLV